MGLQNFYFRLLGYYKLSTCHCRRNNRLRFGPWVGKIPWRRKWQCTPVFLPGKFHGQRNLSCHSSWGDKESDMTEQLNTHTFGYWVKSCVSQYSNKSSLEILTSRSFYPCICSGKKGTCCGTDYPRGPPLTIVTFCLMGAVFANQGEITIGSCHHSPKPLSSYPATQNFPPKQFWSCLEGLNCSPPCPSS